MNEPIRMTELIKINNDDFYVKNANQNKLFIKTANELYIRLLMKMSFITYKANSRGIL
jgi:hypothetical protein